MRAEHYQTPNMHIDLMSTDKPLLLRVQQRVDLHKNSINILKLYQT